MTEPQSAQPQTTTKLHPSRKGREYPAMTHLLQIQRDLAAVTLSDKTEPKDKASCARAWKELEMLRRIMKGKPVTVEAARLKLPKQRKLGTITPMSDADESKDGTGYGLPV